MNTSLLGLLIGRREVPLSIIQKVRLERCADQPDSLSVAFLEEGPGAIPGKCGEEVELWVGGRLCFGGRVGHRFHSVDAGGKPVTGFRAVPRWLERAELLPFEEEYREMTDAEIAARLADALGLSGRIDPTGRVHPRMLRCGDPLGFLKMRARASGFFLAVAAGCLHFTSSLPANFRTRALGTGSRVFLRKGFWKGPARWGSVALAGALDIDPLDRLRLYALGPTVDGLHRVVRVRINLGRRGLMTEVFWVQNDRDLSWVGEELDRMDDRVHAPGVSA